MKKKKKSKLQKKIEDPNSRLWRNKADKLWKELVVKVYSGKCAICQSTEYCQAHHLIPREMTSHRHSTYNGILLCASHHKYSFELSPHKAPVEFFKWMLTHHKYKWEWLLMQRPSREHQYTFKEIFETLLPQTNINLEMEKITWDAAVEEKPVVPVLRLPDPQQ